MAHVDHSVFLCYVTKESDYVFLELHTIYVCIKKKPIYLCNELSFFIKYYMLLPVLNAEKDVKMFPMTVYYAIIKNQSLNYL